MSSFLRLKESRILHERLQLNRAKEIASQQIQQIKPHIESLNSVAQEQPKIMQETSILEELDKSNSAPCRLSLDKQQFNSFLIKYRENIKNYNLYNGNNVYLNIRDKITIPLEPSFNSPPEDSFYMSKYQDKRALDKKLIIHVHVVCYNEEFIIPHFLKHYHYASKIYIYDNCSTDNSVYIAKQDPRCEIVYFSSMFDDSVNQNIKNNCWKMDRGECDYSIVCDMDEFLLFQKGGICIYTYLQNAKDNNITYSFLNVKGFNMVSMDTKYNVDEFLYNQINKGYGDDMYSKCNIFSPNDIISMNYSPGSHECSPCNDSMRFNIGCSISLLHFKFIGGLKRLKQRQVEYNKRLSQKNINECQGLHYQESNSIELQYEDAINKRVKLYDI